MRKLILLLILIFVFLVRTAEAKSIVYVTGATSYSPCSILPVDDSLFCTRLIDLGYDVTVINEEYVRQNMPVWRQYVNESDMIFLGHVNVDMINGSMYQDAFCGNISDVLENRTLFAAFENTWYNQTFPSNITGCAFYPTITLVNISYFDNKCNQRTFKIIREGFVTEGYELGDVIEFYNTIRSLRTFNISDGGWIAAECTPRGAIIDFYPVVNTSSKGVFWGLENPQSFTNKTWELFDRALLTALGDISWDILPTVIPSVATVDQEVWIISNVTQIEKPAKGIVKFTANGFSGDMPYIDGLWRNYTFTFPEAKDYYIEISGYSISTLRGKAGVPITVGNLDVDIISGNFKPGSDYLVSVKLYLDGEPQEPSSANFRILNSLNFETVFSGSMICGSTECTAKINFMPDVQDLILEVTAVGESGDVGGSFKIISKEPITTNKVFYQPGETMKIELFYSLPLTDSNFTLIRPDGAKETGPIIMTEINPNHWKTNYTLETTVPNGTYVIEIVSLKENKKIVEFTKNIDVIAWETSAYLNKYSFESYETLYLTVEVTNKYSNTLEFDILVEIKDPEDKKIQLAKDSFTGETYRTNYSIPGDYKSGRSKILITLNDSDGRIVNLGLNLSINSTLVITPSLSIKPDLISEITTIGKQIKKSFILENSADIDSGTLFFNVSSNLKNAITIEPSPDSIPANGKGVLLVTIDTTTLSEAFYPGTIDIDSRIGKTKISVKLEVLGDYNSKVQDKLDELLYLKENITDLKNRGADVTNIDNLYEQIKDLLEDVKIDFSNEDYTSAKVNLQTASTQIETIRSMLEELQEITPAADYSYIIWYFAIGIVVVIIIITVIKFRKKLKRKKKERGEEEEAEEIYYKPQKEYRTEYY